MIAHPRPLSSEALFGARHDRTAFNILANVYEPLVERGPDLAIRPRLAESWYSPDERTWVFKLRRGVLRHDGRILTAGDVVASFERARADPWAAGALAPVSGVRANGENEIVFTTREPFDALPARLVYIYVSGRPEPGGATGPYRLRPGTPGGNVVLEAFPGYRDGRAPIATVEFRMIKDPRERARCLLRREAELIEDIVPDDMPALRAARGIRTLALPGFTTAFLAMDTARGRDAGRRSAGQPLPRPAGARGDGPGDRPARAGLGAAPGLRRPDRPARASRARRASWARSSRRCPTCPAPARCLGKRDTPTASTSRSTTCRERWTVWSRCWAGSWRPSASASAREATTRPSSSPASSATTRPCTCCGGSSRARRSRRPTRGSCTRPGASSAR